MFPVALLDDNTPVLSRPEPVPQLFWGRITEALALLNGTSIDGDLDVAAAIVSFREPEAVCFEAEP
jgi:hypothetical protein